MRGFARLDGLSEVLGCQPELLPDVIQRLPAGKEILRFRVGRRPPLKTPRGKEVRADLVRARARLAGLPENLGTDIPLCSRLSNGKEDACRGERKHYPAPRPVERRTWS